MSDSFEVRFRGVRGSIACPGPATLRYGGNTACIELRCGERLVVLDAGTGIRGLGTDLVDAGPLEADILLSHTHLDHVLGLPFFAPLFDARNRFTVRAGHLATRGGLRPVLERMLSPELFPLPLEGFAAELGCIDFRAGAAFALGGGIYVRTAPLDHPGGATGYRIEYSGRSVCYVSDTGHKPGAPNRDILGLIEGADIVIYDAMFTEEEFARRPDWGHSTWNEGARLCEAAGADRLVLFHHDPRHDDAAMDRLVTDAAACQVGVEAAREGMVLSP
ncbi:MAG: MBL fold metallo-hydrolase [Alphaproteobacteria bacterium]|nr:MBL fold metallo-hydrolase [Alphaproteobacteria bacterium]